MKIATLLFIAFVTISSFGFAQIVTIGTQTWTTKNLDVATFRNGDAIPEAKTNEEWQEAEDNKQPAWCYYNNDPKHGTKYGKLYNWYAVNDSRGLAPTGFHIPSDEEWTVLDIFLGSDKVSAKKMKMAPEYGPTIISYVDEGGYYEQKWVACSNCKNWNSEYSKKVPCHVCKDERGRTVQGKYIPKTKRKVEKKGEQIDGWNGDNSSGFSALPGGLRLDNGIFSEGEYKGAWLSASGHPKSFAWYRKLSSSDNDWLYRFKLDGTYFGASVRCVKD